jgi:AraC family transcriptional regulator of adaptative response/methylated-DNA-[protein]-cysteine methyltransferase
LHLFGTNFQMQVWKALLKIPSRHYVSYEGIADAIGRPQSCRAVGNAVGANPICLLIPCHRVIQKSGVLGHYSSGPSRKKALLGIECRANSE